MEYIKPLKGLQISLNGVNISHQILFRYIFNYMNAERKVSFAAWRQVGYSSN